MSTRMVRIYIFGPVIVAVIFCNAFLITSYSIWSFNDKEDWIAMYELCNVSLHTN